MNHDDDKQTGSRWDVLSRTFGLVRASGDLSRDLSDHKRVALQRGFAVQSVKRVASESDGGEVFEFVASSGGDVKRDGNAVLNGKQNWLLDNFRMNPRFTWNHSYDQLPLGTVVDVQPEGSGPSAILRSFHRFSKRWDFYFYNAQAIEQVLSKFSFAYHLIKISMSGGQDAHVGLHFFI